MWGRIPRVRVNGNLYYNTRRGSTVPGRCGNMDGEIPSMADGAETPIKDNQPGFGNGFGYHSNSPGRHWGHIFERGLKTTAGPGPSDPVSRRRLLCYSPITHVFYNRIAISYSPIPCPSNCIICSSSCASKRALWVSLYPLFPLSICNMLSTPYPRFIFPVL